MQIRGSLALIVCFLLSMFTNHAWVAALAMIGYFLSVEKDVIIFDFKRDCDAD